MAKDKKSTKTTKTSTKINTTSKEVIDENKSIDEVETEEEITQEEVEETEPKKVEEVEDQDIDIEEFAAEAKKEEVIQEKKVVEEVKKDFYFELGAKTIEEKKLVEFIKEYIDATSVSFPKLTDVKRKVNALQNILLYPISSNVKDPSVMYDMVEKFVTEYRKKMLVESVAMKNADVINNQVIFTRMITVYNTMIALVDYKQNVSPFKINISKVKDILGIKFDGFITWITKRVEKLNKR